MNAHHLVLAQLELSRLSSQLSTKKWRQFAGKNEKNDLFAKNLAYYVRSSEDQKKKNGHYVHKCPILTQSLSTSSKYRYGNDMDTNK